MKCGNTYTEHRRAITTELGAWRLRSSTGARFRVPPQICSYAFTQHVLRELRAHTSLWTETVKATQPRGMLARPGLEQTRAMTSDIVARRKHWPFHLAGDSGVRLFNHRAWISWRYLALLELPSFSLCELPMLSTDLQALIETTRSQITTVEPIAPNRVEEIRFEMLSDPAKALWLRRALKLTQQSEDSVVKEQLLSVVTHAFTVLQSPMKDLAAHETSMISPRFVACVALFLHLQNEHCKERTGAWQPFFVKERSARATKSGSTLKRYVTSQELGDDADSPLTQFPRCCNHLTAQLDPEVHPIATPPVLCWLCGAGFLSWQGLYRHALAKHGDYAEYRKHLFWLAQKQGFQPMLPWQKRHMLANLSFFQCFSIPESGAIEWTEGHSIQTVVQRQEVGCAICARKDWMEHRFRVYLWREPDNAKGIDKKDRG